MFGFKDWREYYTGYVNLVFIRFLSGLISPFTAGSFHKLCSSYVSVMFQLCFSYVPVMFQLCFSYAPVMFQLCSSYVPVMFQLCFSYVSVMF